jgi:ribose transport system ATP-binding protein
VRAIFGADPIDSGRIYVTGKPAKIGSPQDAVRNGIGLLTEDRKQQGLCLQMSVRENITLSVLGRLTRGLRTDLRKEARLAQRFITNMAIKASSQDQLAVNLSGGTQQKVVLSKWLATEPKVLIFDEPTRGIDVGAKSEIYRLLNDLAQQGKAIIMISSELPEILRMSHRIVVMCEGRITGELSAAEATQEKIMTFATQREAVAAA